MKKKDKPNPLFVVAADDWRNTSLSMQKASTYKVRGYLIKELVEEFGDIKVGSISRSMIQNFVVRLSYSLSPGTVRSYVNVLKSILESADEDFEMPKRISLPKNKKRRQNYYTVEEMKSLIRVSSGIDRLLIMLLCETGCRIGEAVALGKSDIKNGSAHITKNCYEGVIQNTPKTDSSVREVCLTETILKELLVLPEGLLFQSPGGRPLWPQTFTYSLQKLCKSANVPYKSPHAFRRGNITFMINDLLVPETIVGMRVGHASTSITLSVYTITEFGKDKIWVPKIEEILYKPLDNSNQV